MTEVSPEVVAQLAPTGVLRAGINMSNFLLVVDKTASGDPIGPSPSLALAIADALGVPLKLVPFDTPSEVAAAAGKNIWDIGNIGAEPQRATVMDFTAAYVEIQATYLVPPGSPIQSVDEVDRPGNRISVSKGSAYGLYLENHIKQAELLAVEGGDAAFDAFVNDKLEAYASLRPRLVTEVEKMPGSRILDGQFSAVQQAVGVNKGNPAAYAWVKDFVETAKSSGMVAGFIETHGVQGKLSVAPPA
ncbi:MAG: transporter substrate-binding domain-containing protein [Rhodospirillaceae bacterium]|jgi:polar amino acid transport system substrate-binding protein|nr:transporter substrate-binding domain-containing protein [Rhodospirillaceae bacterium]MBT5665503.1 transporter substrate-binding domain-containing protein [Rhodospirillaceae bacterium]